MYLDTALHLGDTNCCRDIALIEERVDSSRRYLFLFFIQYSLEVKHTGPKMFHKVTFYDIMPSFGLLISRSVYVLNESTNCHGQGVRSSSRKWHVA